MKTTRGKVPTSRAVVTSLSRAAQSAKACPVSDATHRDPRCLSAIISGLALDDRPLEALRLFKWFQTSSLDPDEFTLSNALSLSANLSALDQGRQIQAFIFKKNLPMDVAATNSLINLYFKCGSIADAEKVFDGMLLRDVYTWNNRNKTSSKTLPRFQKLYSRRKLLSTKAVRKEPTIEKPVPVSTPPKDAERQLSKKELKKKEMAELDALLHEMGIANKDSNTAQNETTNKKQLEQSSEGQKKESVGNPLENRILKKKKSKKEK
ncbi:hypothetical protein ZIOFF_048763 [Zingiber officinale]|uniref:Pentatricopeptide repeat-containing protein n=1 Tax=Zingiber officinale TaxID=94328 RepID=A0A8J5KUI9_ZINOF|nr:hypothetical protein ZIOFF_048763 [Zingiber officinale]